MGIKSQQQGKDWETWFQFALSISDISWVRLPPSGGMFIGADNFIGQHIVCDYIIGKGGRTILLDVKSKGGKTFSYSNIHDRPHQLPMLYDFYSDGKGCKLCGFVVFYINLGSVIFYHVDTLKKVIPRGGLKPGDGLFLGKTDEKLNFDLLFK